LDFRYPRRQPELATPSMRYDVIGGGTWESNGRAAVGPVSEKAIYQQLARLARCFACRAWVVALWLRKHVIGVTARQRADLLHSICRL